VPARLAGPSKYAGATELTVRPHVVIYVTREHPATGADEFLVFDVPGQPEFTAIVPGGGIDEGESVEGAAVREAREETGIDVRVLRTLGTAEHPGQREPHHVHHSHFVQATPLESLPDEWEHHITGHGEEAGSLVRCYWLPVRADAEVWGHRGHHLGDLVRKRVVGYVTRDRELLVFDHAGTTQLPAGRIDAHESLEEGLVREVEEETGLAGVHVVGELADAAEFARLYGPGAHESHAFHAVTDAETPGAWEHHVTGTGMDAGIVYPCRWVPLETCPPLWGKPDPLAERLRESLTEE
jgi:8-oxo-dGTP pyrophosphatase MutT (NUDIX family)